LPNCSRRCDGRTADCNASCTSNQERADAAARAKEPAMPCGSAPAKQGGKVVMLPCSESDTKLYKEALDSPALKQMLKCKDANGRPAACKEDLDRQKQVMNELNKDSLCKDEQGNAQVCPETMKRVEKVLKPQ
jgi:hypothetical protein